MFTIRSIIYFYFISIIFAKNVQSQTQEVDPIIEPLELQLQSTDNEGILYCNSGLDIYKQKGKLMTTIDYPIVAPPPFLLTTEQTNSTTIRIRIKPNGYIGINRIRCHWSDNATDERPADLIIGEYPGVIQLKQPCQAYDRRYVKCVIKAEKIARAFQNGFPILYSFKEMNFDPKAYRPTPILANIINNTDLVFHFEPSERNIIPKKTSMYGNITLKRFGSSIYRFNIEPLHTTKVDFQIENITNKEFAIRINHNNTGTIYPRLCAGYISYVDAQNRWTQVQDISETSERNILVTGLHASTEYKTCLHCYYDRNDESYKADICNHTQTMMNKCDRRCIGFITVAGVITIVVIVIGLIVYFRRKSSGRLEGRPVRPETPISINRIMVIPDPLPEDPHYTPEPQEEHPLISTHPERPIDSTTETEKYKHLEDAMEGLLHGNKVSPDTIDLTR